MLAWLYLGLADASITAFVLVTASARPMRQSRLHLRIPLLQMPDPVGRRMLQAILSLCCLRRTSFDFIPGSKQGSDDSLDETESA